MSKINPSKRSVKSVPDTPRPNYRPRTREQVRARINAANDGEVQPRRKHSGLGKFFCDPAYLPSIAAALGIKPNVWHRALLPKEVRKRYGNRGCLMVHDKEHGQWIKYCVMGVGRVRRGKKHYFRPHRIFASKFLGISPVGKISPVAAWQLDALLLVEAGHLLMPQRRYAMPDKRAAKAFGFEKPHEQELKVQDEKRRVRKVTASPVVDVGALFDLPQAPPFVWKAAVAVLDRVTLMRDLLIQHNPETHLVHRTDEDGGDAKLIQIDNSWLAHLCRPNLRDLANWLGWPYRPTAQDLEALAGELRRRLYRAGMLRRVHVQEPGQQHRWMFGPALLTDTQVGMTKQDLLMMFSALAPNPATKL